MMKMKLGNLNFLIQKLQIFSTKTLAPSKSFQDALLAIMAENPDSPKKFDEIEWDEYGSGLIQALYFSTYS